MSRTRTEIHLYFWLSMVLIVVVVVVWRLFKRCWREEPTPMSRTTSYKQTYTHVLCKRCTYTLQLHNNTHKLRYGTCEAAPAHTHAHAHAHEELHTHTRRNPYTNATAMHMFPHSATSRARQTSKPMRHTCAHCSTACARRTKTCTRKGRNTIVVSLQHHTRETST